MVRQLAKAQEIPSSRIDHESIPIFKNGLFLIQVVTHLSVIPMILFAQLEHYLISFSVYFLTGCFGMSMTVHRLLAHRSWKAPRWFEILGSVFATLGLTGSPLAWVSVHRTHHKQSDLETDPHSPHHQSWFSVQFLSMKFKPRLRNSKDLLKDPFQKFLHKNYLKINILFLVALILVDPFLAIYLYLFPAFILWHAGSAINTLGHMWGYKNYPTKDKSVNNPLLGILMFGEGWHNNHHRYLKSPKFGHKWFELDISAMFIRLIQKR